MPPEPQHPTAALALALLRMDGVGRVAAGRLIERWATLPALRQTPREQVLLRLPGIARADGIVQQLFDPAFDARLAEAEAAVEMMAKRRIEVLTPHHPDWPPGLADLSRSERPVVLYAFGDTSLLRRPTLAFLAHPPLEGPPFELAQDLVRYLLPHKAVPATGLQHGFDTVVCKLAAGAGQPAMLVAAAGLSRVPTAMRPAAAAAVKAGGLLISPFPVDHGPFPHDDHERARLLVALSQAAFWVGAPAGSAEQRVLPWTAEKGRPVFSVTEVEGVETRRVVSREQFGSILDAVRAGEA